MEKEKRVVDKILMRRIGRKLDERIREKGIEKNKLAAMVGLSRSTLMHVLAGERSLPVDQLVNIAVVLGVDPCEFIRLEKDDIRALEMERDLIRGELARLYEEAARSIGTSRWGEVRDRIDELTRELDNYEMRIKLLTSPVQSLDS